MFKNFFLVQFLLLLLLKSVSAAKVEEINISGNERISKDTIIIFGEIDIKDDFNKDKINEILKNTEKLIIEAGKNKKNMKHKHLSLETSFILEIAKKLLQLLKKTSF